MPKSSKHYLTLDQQVVAYSKKMLASWLASKKAKSCQQNILQLCAEHTITDWDNKAFGKFVSV